MNVAAGLAFFVMLLLLRVIYIRVRDKPIRDAVWRSLAENGLQFLPPRLPYTGPGIAGAYRGCRLELHPMAGVTILTLTALHPLENKSVPQIEESLHQTMTLVEAAQVLRDNMPANVKGTVTVGQNGQMIYYEQMGLEQDLAYLKQLFNRFSALINIYPHVIVLGADMVPLLKQIAVANDNGLQPLARQWLHNIAAETTDRLGDRASSLICSICLVGCSAHTISLSVRHHITYYGCRFCKQSQEILDVRVIAVLDRQMKQERRQQNGVLRVNWLARRNLFDFKEVEIVEATDEDTERFAVQIGNNPDVAQKVQDEKIRCTVRSSSQLSENTLRILRKIFKGQVVS